MRDRRGERKTTVIVKEGRQKNHTEKRKTHFLKKKKKDYSQNLKVTALVYGTTGDFFSPSSACFLNFIMFLKEYCFYNRKICLYFTFKIHIQICIASFSLTESFSRRAPFHTKMLINILVLFWFG